MASAHAVGAVCSQRRFQLAIIETINDEPEAAMHPLFSAHLRVGHSRSCCCLASSLRVVNPGPGAGILVESGFFVDSCLDVA